MFGSGSYTGGFLVRMYRARIKCVLKHILLLSWNLNGSEVFVETKSIRKVIALVVYAIHMILPCFASVPSYVTFVPFC